MPITYFREIETPWAPYALTFSHDASRLAVGGGSWYGNGGILLIGVDDDQSGSLRWADVPWIDSMDIGSLTTMPSGRPAVSGLCFSDDDRYLAASMWSARQHYAPTMLFEVDGVNLRPQNVLEHDSMISVASPGPDVTTHNWDLGTPTGVLLYKQYVVTRHHDTDPEGRGVIVLHRIPRVELRAEGRTQHLTHSRVVVVRDAVITEAGGSRTHMTRRPDGTYARVPTPEGLALRDLSTPEAPLRIIDVDDCPRITAIAALPGNSGFLTGGLRGEIDAWSWHAGCNILVVRYSSRS